MFIDLNVFRLFLCFTGLFFHSFFFDFPMKSFLFVCLFFLQNDCKLSSVQRIIDRLDLDKNDNNLRLWMSSSLYDNEFVVSPLILQKILHYPI